jgi:hypothetical protein
VRKHKQFKQKPAQRYSFKPSHALTVPKAKISLCARYWDSVAQRRARRLALFYPGQKKKGALFALGLLGIMQVLTCLMG